MLYGALSGEKAGKENGEAGETSRTLLLKRSNEMTAG